MIDRPTIDLVIPVQRDSNQLSRTVALIDKHTKDYRLHIVTEPSLNVSEARQKAMDEIVKNDLVCFLDDDSEMMHDGWLDAAYAVLASKADAGAVFAGEQWGTDSKPLITAELGVIPAGEQPCCEVERGPAACMLLDRRRIPSDVQWDSKIGLRNGWLGGDFEEVDYCYRLVQRGLKLYRATNTIFHHTGGRTTMAAWQKTDRQRAVIAMQTLLSYKYAKAPDDGDWFSGLEYVKANPNDDTMLAPGSNLRDCYHKVIARNGLGHVRCLNRMGLV